MRSYLIAGLAVLMLGLGGTATWYKLKADRLGSALSIERAVTAGLRRSNVALQELMAEVEAEREHWRQVAVELETVEGADEALNPYERAVLERVLRSPD